MKKNSAFEKLLAEAVKDEGKKSVMKIGDARELLAILKKKCKDDNKKLDALLRYFGVIVAN